MEQNEGYNPEDSVSDSAEELLWRGMGGGQYICDFSKGGYMKSRHITAEGNVSHKEQM